MRRAIIATVVIFGFILAVGHGIGHRAKAKGYVNECAAPTQVWREADGSIGREQVCIKRRVKR